MATLTTTKNYADTTLLLADDFDVFLDEIETFINTTKINDDNILAAGLVGSTVFKNISISAAKINTSAVTTAKIADSAITTVEILDANVTAAKIADSAATTAKIGPLQVTRAKLATLNSETTTTSGADVTIVAGGGLIPTLELTSSTAITTVGRPVIIMLTTANNAGSGNVGITTGVSTPAGSALSFAISLVRTNSAVTGSTQTFLDSLSYSTKSASSGSYSQSWLPGSFFFMDQPAAGTYEYYIYINGLETNVSSAFFNDLVLTAYEVS